MCKLVGLYSSKPQSGKSKVAEICSAAGWHIEPFAATLKEMLTPFLLAYTHQDEDIVRRMLYEDLKEELIPELNTTTRKLLQTLGTDWGRETVHSEVWIRAWRHKVEHAWSTGRTVIVDDMRFPNEFDAIKSMGGETWLICRNSHAKTHNHASEGSLDNHTDKFDQVIVNNSSLDDLKQKIDNLIK